MYSARTLLSIRGVALAMVCVLGSRGGILAEQSPAAAQAAKPSGTASTLRSIPALQVNLTVDFKAPKAQEIVARLRAATKMDLTLADDINQEYPALGSLSCRNTPAWVIMEELAKSKRVEGRWEKDATGYRLVRNGNPVVIREAPEPRVAASQTPWGWIILAATCVLLSLSLAYWWVRRRGSQALASTLTRGAGNSPIR